MKIRISGIRTDGSHVEIEAEDLAIAVNAYVTINNLAKQGLMPPPGNPYVSGGPSGGAPIPTDAGVQFPLPEPQDVQEERVVAEAPPVPERETEKPGKSRRARKQVAENVAPAAPAEAAPEKAEEPVATPESVAENVAPRVVSQDEARRAMTEAAKELGQPGLVKVLSKLGVARFGLYIADDYAPVLRAIEEVKAEMAGGAK